MDWTGSSVMAILGMQLHAAVMESREKKWFL
jgi:hypothetical protein